VTQAFYKGSYYQVQVYTDDDNEFFIDTVDEWDMGDRVGISIKPEDIKVVRREPSPDDEVAATTDEEITDGQAEEVAADE
ncbi:MAG: hypothetical protein K2M48_06160, partial [Clostridiales bacterium]|nr:hypothetical protein [Clostridiales bacterium]